MQDPNLIRLLIAHVELPRDTVFVLQQAEPWWRTLFDAVATFATLAGFTLAYFEWRRAKREERLRLDAEAKAVRSVDHQIATRILELVREMDVILARIQALEDPHYDLKETEIGLQQIVSLAPGASSEVSHRLTTAFRQFYFALDDLRKAKDLVGEAQRSSIEHGANALRTCVAHLSAAVPTELL